jgi:hypothetical protein
MMKRVLSFIESGENRRPSKPPSSSMRSNPARVRLACSSATLEFRSTSLTTERFTRRRSSSQSTKK